MRVKGENVVLLPPVEIPASPPFSQSSVIVLKNKNASCIACGSYLLAIHSIALCIFTIVLLTLIEAVVSFYA